MMKKILLAAVFCLLTSSVMAETEPCFEGTCFTPTRNAGSAELPLKGMAKLNFMRFDMYTGALYAPENVKTPREVLGNIPKVLVLHYHRNIKVEWMNSAASRIIKKNPENDYAKLKDRIGQMGRAYKKVGKNDRYALVYEPGKGTSLYLNDDFVIQIPGEDFQKAYFGIWLSEYPAKPAFRDKLLGIQEAK
jgi:hypothetical protein